MGDAGAPSGMAHQFWLVAALVLSGGGAGGAGVFRCGAGAEVAGNGGSVVGMAGGVAGSTGGWGVGVGAVAVLPCGRAGSSGAAGRSAWVERCPQCGAGWVSGLARAGWRGECGCPSGLACAASCCGVGTADGGGEVGFCACGRSGWGGRLAGTFGACRDPIGAGGTRGGGGARRAGGIWWAAGRVGVAREG